MGQPEASSRGRWLMQLCPDRIFCGPGRRSRLVLHHQPAPILAGPITRALLWVQLREFSEHEQVCGLTRQPSQRAPPRWAEKPVYAMLSSPRGGGGCLDCGSVVDLVVCWGALQSMHRQTEMQHISDLGKSSMLFICYFAGWLGHRHRLVSAIPSLTQSPMFQ